MVFRHGRSGCDHCCMRTRVRRQAGEDGALRLGWLVVLAGILLAGGLVALELWSTPPGWLLPSRRRTVAGLHWITEHWLNAAAVGTVTGLIAALTPFVFRWLDRGRSEQSGTQAPQGRERLVMARRVRHKWVTGVLEPSLADAARLTLGLEHRPDLLDLGTRALRSSDRSLLPFPAGVSLGEVFDQTGGGLLILGAPGAGKTTLLLQLANELLDRAERDPDEPIPVVVSLASWARRRQPLTAWLVDELVDGYSVPRRIARAWMAADAFVLLLDGLDEVAGPHRVACAEAINAYRRDHGLVPLVVCSRTYELQLLAIRLRLEEAVELQPPSDAQIDAYLGHLEATGTPLADVRAALATDQELQALLRSPLLLHVLVLAYHGRPAPALQLPGSLGERQARLWDAHVRAATAQSKRRLQQRAGTSLAGVAGRQTARPRPNRVRPRPSGLWLASDSNPATTRTPCRHAGRGAARRDGHSGGRRAGLSNSARQHCTLSRIGRRADRRAHAEHCDDRRAALVPGRAGRRAGRRARRRAGRRTGRPARSRASGHLLPDCRRPGRRAPPWTSRSPRSPAAWRANQGLGTRNEARWRRGGLAIGVTGGVLLGWWGAKDVGLIAGIAFGLAYGLSFGLIFGPIVAVRNERTRPNDGIRRSARYSLVIGLAVA